jgi:hypothetical protein
MASTLRLSSYLRNKLNGVNTNKVTNGSFTSATTGWTSVTATLTSVAGGQSGNCLKVAEAGGADPGSAYQDVTTKINHIYLFSTYFKKGDADNGKIQVGSSVNADLYYDSGNLSDADWVQHPHVDADGKKMVAFIASTTTTRITCITNDATAAEYSLFDEVSLISLSHAIQDIFYGGFLEVFAGVQPASPDTNTTGSTLLFTLYSNGTSTGLHFDDSASGILTKLTGEVWSGTAGADGTASWFRLKTAGDSGATGTLEERLDGSIATSGADMIMSNTLVVISSLQSCTTFQLTLPASA